MPLPSGAETVIAPRSVEESSAARFPFSRTMTGYQDLMENRLARGSFFTGPSAV